MNFNYRMNRGVASAGRQAALLAEFAAMLVLITGCPAIPGDGSGDSVVDVAVSASLTSGTAPLTVVFSGQNSTSPNGGPYRYSWNFADAGATSDSVQPTHTFSSPGLYTVALRVTDAAGEEGIASVDVRVRGVGASAVITSDVSSGPAPLLVRFDGQASSAPDDIIRDFFWDFGDGTTSRIPAPTHQYNRSGTFTVTLRVVTGGGVEDTATATIRVDSSSASLEFSTGDRATLAINSLGTSGKLDALSVECWFKAANSGGTLLSLGNGSLAIGVSPATSKVVLQLGSATTEFDAGALASQWRHLAVTYNADQIGATVYLDGASIGTAPIAAPPEIDVSVLVLGGNYGGLMSEVRLWQETLTTTEVASRRRQRLSGNESGLARYWQLDEGTGQFLGERVNGDTGIRGTTTSEETADPVWTTDSPPVSE